MAAGIIPAAFGDRILTKSDHGVILMMEKIKKYIIRSAEDKVLNIDQKDIEQYLSEVKEAVEMDNYRLERNGRINSISVYQVQQAGELFRDRHFVP